MVVIVRDWYRWYLEGKDIPHDRNDCHLIYRKAIENIGWRGDWEYTTAVAVGRGRGDIVVSVILVMCGYIVDKSLNHQWFESFCKFQVTQGRY